MPSLLNKICLEQIGEISIQHIKIGDILIYYRRQGLAKSPLQGSFSTNFTIYEVAGLPADTDVLLRDSYRKGKDQKFLRTQLLTGGWWYSTGHPPISAARNPLHKADH